MSGLLGSVIRGDSFTLGGRLGRMFGPCNPCPVPGMVLGVTTLSEGGEDVVLVDVGAGQPPLTLFGVELVTGVENSAILEDDTFARVQLQLEDIVRAFDFPRKSP